MSRDKEWKREARPGRLWHLDEMAIRIGREQHWLWGAVDEHQARLDVLVLEQRETDAAERFFRVLLGHAGAAPERINTDKLGSLRPCAKSCPPGGGVHLFQDELLVVLGEEVHLLGEGAARLAHVAAR